mgnify:CR=1 FL=1
MSMEIEGVGGSRKPRQVDHNSTEYQILLQAAMNKRKTQENTGKEGIAVSADKTTDDTIGTKKDNAIKDGNVDFATGESVSTLQHIGANQQTDTGGSDSGSGFGGQSSALIVKNKDAQAKHESEPVFFSFEAKMAQAKLKSLGISSEHTNKALENIEANGDHKEMAKNLAGVTRKDLS